MSENVHGEDARSSKSSSSDSEEEVKVSVKKHQIDAAPEVIVEKSKSKLERLLAQPDIFECLRRINLGLIRSYDDLQMNNT